jgi:diadenosine tetraphosphate (Ap4A) HIT family hydrolase
MADMTGEKYDVDGCLCCDITAGRLPAPGGTILDTGRWHVDHILDSLGVGTLIVKPVRHVTSVGALDPDEAAELGPVLQRVSQVVQELTDAGQVYVCLWSHAGGTATHIHFVVQPITKAHSDRYGGYGPHLQQAMFAADELLDRNGAIAFAAQARQLLTAT